MEPDTRGENWIPLIVLALLPYVCFGLALLLLR